MTTQSSEITITSSHQPQLVHGAGFNDLTGMASSKAYKVWASMLERCYCPKFKARNSDYDGCHVDEEWLTFSTFYRWYEESIEAIGHSDVQLDKDILAQGNKMYGPDRCLLVSKALNVFFTIYRRNKTSTLPIGVRKSTLGHTFEARLSSKSLGHFKTPEAASMEYVRIKRNEFRDRFYAEFDRLDGAGLLPDGFTAWGAMKAIAEMHWPKPEL